jgi:CheY-like chemotaxis protein
MMPVMDGWEFLEERAKDESLRAVPVVIVSATPDNLQPPDICAFVRKPMRLDDLLEVIARECLPAP